MIFDYATLKLIWWAFVGIIIVTFALTDGWDMGIGILSPLLGKTDEERRVILRSIEPNWEGNQTWFVIAGGVIFAAWPLVYAAAFSGLYVALLLVLFASCRHSCSASRSVTCCSVFRFSSTVTCGCFIRALSGACSMGSRCLRAWLAWPC